MVSATEAAMTDRHIVSTILRHLSDMKYKDRRQYGPDQPVEFLEFRPTLVPAILVNRLWGDEGTGILWRRYPHVPALRGMTQERRQYYANKVERLFAMSPPDETLEYLEDLTWPNLKNLEFEVDFKQHGEKFKNMMHAGLEHLDLSGFQSGDSKYFTETVLPMVFTSCTNLKSIRIGPEIIVLDDPIHSSTLFEHLDSVPSIDTVEIRSANFTDKDALFTRLSQRPGLHSLEIDLDPGLALLPLLSNPNALPLPFSSLKRMLVMCYPEVALTLPAHLTLAEELQFDIARIPNQSAKSADQKILGNLIDQLSHCPKLRVLRISVGQLAEDFPSFSALPKLPGDSLTRLAASCPKLEDINLSVVESSSIDGSGISAEQFDTFCKALPDLRTLNLKFNPTTVSALSTTALQSLGTHCPKLEILRLKVPFHLPSLPVPAHIPQTLISGDHTPGPLTPSVETALLNANPVDPLIPETSSIPTNTPFLSPTSPTSPTIPPLFPHLTHLALARPETPLCTITENDTFTVSSSGEPELEHIDAEVEASLVRTWAHPLLAHFPHLEILEAWGDFSAADEESLNYFLPIEEILASVWEFLSGVEQDLWDDIDEDVLGMDGGLESWHTGMLNTPETGSVCEDWDKASLMNEFVVEGDGGAVAVGTVIDSELHMDLEPRMAKLGLSGFEEEPDGMLTPGLERGGGTFAEAQGGMAMV